MREPTEQRHDASGWLDFNWVLAAAACAAALAIVVVVGRAIVTILTID